MNFIKLIFTKAFLKQIGIAVGVLIVLIFLIMQWLKYSTNHGEFKTVPDLSRLSFEEAKAKLAENDLSYKLQDTINYNPDYPAFSVIEQSPVAGDKVKEDRKIYLKINPSKYREITIPHVIQITRRTAESTLNAVGFEVEKVIYKDNIGKDMVLGIQYKGKPINPGDRLPKMSKVELILGNGNRPGGTVNEENDNNAGE
ncbi:PASTA domain-containing protein [Kordia sp. YSTF-M3]|uniref:PASTA domain-containing protein n=1 Tax=Kordia aestuariivivens TaxID=2759037 RepID=A0ABR7Q4Z0_9FLAO|nr:PASTA domain-containing protein [Kordia aestuariivivens]MBC8753612.1 PASTA domain-containing protein [Kordia aestuariivivens]